jgi:hypothetical protein
VVETTCRTNCAAACEAGERILNVYALNPGGTFVFEDDNRVSFRPLRRGGDTKVVVACIPK